jgi:hypothetical protein
VYTKVVFFSIVDESDESSIAASPGEVASSQEKENNPSSRKEVQSIYVCDYVKIQYYLAF